MVLGWQKTIVTLYTDEWTADWLSIDAQSNSLPLPPKKSCQILFALKKLYYKQRKMLFCWDILLMEGWLTKTNKDIALLVNVIVACLLSPGVGSESCQTSEY